MQLQEKCENRHLYCEYVKHKTVLMSSSSSIGGTPTIILMDGGSTAISNECRTGITNMYDTSQFQQSAQQVAQPSLLPTYWNPVKNCYYIIQPMPAYRPLPTLPILWPLPLSNPMVEGQISGSYPPSTIPLGFNSQNTFENLPCMSIVPSNPPMEPHYQTYFPKVLQRMPRFILPSPSPEMRTHPIPFTNSQDLPNDIPTDAFSIGKVLLDAQNSICSLCNKKFASKNDLCEHIEMHKNTNRKYSPKINNVESQITGTHSESTTMLEFYAQSTFENLPCSMPIASSLPEMSIHPIATTSCQNLPDNPVDAINVSSTCEIQPGVQDLSEPASKHTDLEKKFNSEAAKEKRRKRKKYQYFNCTAEGGNKNRDSDGERNHNIQHICHISGCGKIFNEAMHLKRHLRQRRCGKKTFYCAYCNESFACKDRLMSHIEIHLNFKQEEYKNNSIDTGDLKGHPPPAPLPEIKAHNNLTDRINDSPIRQSKPSTQYIHRPWLSEKSKRMTINNNQSSSGNLDHVITASSTSSKTKTDAQVAFEMTEASKLENKSISENQNKSVREKQPVKEPKKNGKEMECKCPNCIVEGGNKTIGFGGRPQHICHIAGCERIYYQVAELRTHLKSSHTVEKPFHCTWPSCDKKFRQKGRLKTHTEMHERHRSNEMENSGQQPFSCTWPSCFKTFTQQWQLKRHTEMHERHRTNEKEYVQVHRSFNCTWPSCGKKFAQKYQLKRHMNVHERHRLIEMEYAEPPQVPRRSDRPSNDIARRFYVTVNSVDIGH